MAEQKKRSVEEIVKHESKSEGGGLAGHEGRNNRRQVSGCKKAVNKRKQHNPVALERIFFKEVL
jgi:hypothetical protein